MFLIDALMIGFIHFFPISLDFTLHEVMPINRRVLTDIGGLCIKQTGKVCEPVSHCSVMTQIPVNWGEMHFVCLDSGDCLQMTQSHAWLK